MIGENEINIEKLRKLGKITIPVWVDGTFGGHFRSRTNISKFKSANILRLNFTDGNTWPYLLYH